MLKATQVDGVYNDDPKKNPKAKKYDTADVRRSDREELEDHGYRGLFPVPGEQHADHRVRFSSRRETLPALLRAKRSARWSIVDRDPDNCDSGREVDMVIKTILLQAKSR